MYFIYGKVKYTLNKAEDGVEIKLLPPQALWPTHIAEAHPTILAAFWSGDLLGIKSKFSCFLFDYENLTINYWSWTIDTSLISSQKSFFMFFNFIFENVIF